MITADTQPSPRRNRLQTAAPAAQVYAGADLRPRRIGAFCFASVLFRCSGLLWIHAAFGAITAGLGQAAGTSPWSEKRPRRPMVEPHESPQTHRGAPWRGGGAERNGWVDLRAGNVPRVFALIWRPAIPSPQAPRAWPDET